MNEDDLEDESEPWLSYRESSEIFCPHCGETFALPAPAPNEIPCEVDYDCEVCCAPMLVKFELEDDEVVAYARGLDD